MIYLTSISIICIYEFGNRSFMSELKNVSEWQTCEGDSKQSSALARGTPVLPDWRHTRVCNTLHSTVNETEQKTIGKLESRMIFSDRHRSKFAADITVTRQLHLAVTVRSTLGFWLFRCIKPQYCCGSYTTDYTTTYGDGKFDSVWANCPNFRCLPLPQSTTIIEKAKQQTEE